MKVQSFGVRNFRGIGPGDQLRFPDGEPPLKQIELDADSIFIIGPNNVGKSTLLYAYEYFVSAKQTASIEDFFNKSSAHQILMEMRLRATAEELVDDQTARWFQNNVATVRKVWNAAGEEAEKFSYDPVAQEWVAGGFWGPRHDTSEPRSGPDIDIRQLGSRANHLSASDPH